MKVVHILKDGTVLDDISGHVVKMEDAPALYSLMDSINANATRHTETTKNT